MNKAVAVTGLGVISPVGNDEDSFWTSLTEGKSGAGPITLFDASSFETRIAAEVKDFKPETWIDPKEARKMARFSQFAVSATLQAWHDASLPQVADSSQSGNDGTPYPTERMAVVLGNGIGGIEVFQDSYSKLLTDGPSRMPPLTIPLMIANEAAANVARIFQLHGPAFTQVTACASGTDAIGQAIDLIRSGRADLVVAGGTEAAISQFAIAGFNKLKALSTHYNDNPQAASRPFDKDRDGFVIGEGAGVLILENYDKAVARGARIRAIASGYGATCDAFHLTAPEPSGVMGAKALSLALEDAGLKPEDIGYYNAHGTSTGLNDPTETAMIKIAFGDYAKDLKISSTKSMTGHCIAAAGALEAIACIKALETGVLPPTINLDNPDLEAGCDLNYLPWKAVSARIDAALTASFGFGGHNGALVFERDRS
ncbi:MAG TPA: beta-ketoacyl-ACP synthase II [Spirochaetales bacterium]|nr:beta-ketoacyl-ACP synthase II [Spirochaetales bacterium]